jgi:hypothetical protein
MVAWTSRLVSSILMASHWFHPDLEFFPKAAQYRSFLLICLSIELVVSILFLLSSSLIVNSLSRPLLFLL